MQPLLRKFLPDDSVGYENALFSKFQEIAGLL